MERVYTEERHGLKIEIIQDEGYQSPEDWGDDSLFLVGYHRDFWVEGPKVFHKLPEGVNRDPQDKGHFLVTKDECIEALQYPRKSSLVKEYHVFPLEAYIHSGVRLYLSGGCQIDRQWDVSQLGAVFCSRKEWKTRAQALERAKGLIETWNDCLSGNVYGFKVLDQDDEEIEACWGFYGDYEKNALVDARACVDHLTNKGLTDRHGQMLFEFMQN